MGMPTATVRLRGPDGQMQVHAAVGAGPVDAAFKAVDEVLCTPNTLLEFVVHAVTEGIDAIGEVTVRIESGILESVVVAQSERDQARTFGGYGADTDIIVASVKAYLSALNKLLAASGQYETTGPTPEQDAVIA
jgi:2-isopropylmalate synthase